MHIELVCIVLFVFKEFIVNLVIEKRCYFAIRVRPSVLPYVLKLKFIILKVLRRDKQGFKVIRRSP